MSKTGPYPPPLLVSRALKQARPSASRLRRAATSRAAARRSLLTSHFFARHPVSSNFTTSEGAKELACLRLANVVRVRLRYASG